MSKPSSVSEQLLLLEGVEDFRDQALALAQGTRKALDILSLDLDFAVFDQSDFVDAVSEVARRSRHTRVRLLIKDTRPVIERGHSLVRLAQRLPSKVELRKLTIEPGDTNMGFMLSDRRGLLFKNDDREHRGFVNFDAAAEVRTLLEKFDYIWEHGKPEPRLRPLKL